MNTLADERAANEAFRASVPSLKDNLARLALLLDRVQPVVRVAGEQWFIEPVDPLTTSYTWDPKPTERAEELVEASRARVFITWAYYGFFKPTIAECLAQIPSNVEEECVAFEIVESPHSAADFRKDDETSKAFDAGFHTCEVVFYKRNT